MKLFEDRCNKFLDEKVKGTKFGILLREKTVKGVEKKYIEFRYVGNVVTEDVVLDKLLYFSYISYLMSNPEFKKIQYYKKLYKLYEFMLGKK